MTEQSQKEFIITKKQLRWYEEHHINSINQGDKIRSRPVPQHSIKPKGCLCDYCEETVQECRERHKQVKQQPVLDVLEQIIRKKRKSFDKHPWWRDRVNLCDDILSEIAELRKQSEAPQQELNRQDEIDELSRKVEWYTARVNAFQCWQSSMRDPERKIVCDILANGFTMTTKEEVTHLEIPRTPKHGDCPDCPILTGEDAKRFHEYLNDPNPPMTPEAQDVIKRALELSLKAPQPALDVLEEKCRKRILPMSQRWAVGQCHVYEEMLSWIEELREQQENRI